MHQLQQPVLVQDSRDARDLDHHRHHHHHPERQHQHYRSHNFHHHPMAFESSSDDPEANPLITSPPSLSDILDNLPSAVRSSLGPLNTIRRSVSIRGWASYFYEISSNTMGAAASHHEGGAATASAGEEHHHRGSSTTVVARTTSTTAVEMQQHSNRGEKRAAAAGTTATHAQSSRRMAEPPLYEELDQNFGINRFCGLQGQLLVNNALSEGRPSSIQGHPPAGRIDRKAYVQGVAWLVHGLPDDLDKHERTELIRAMPPSLLEEAHRTPVSRQPGGQSPAPSSSSTYPLSSPSSVYGYYFGRSTSSVSIGMGTGVSASEAGWALAQRLLRMLWLQLVLAPLHALWAWVLVLLGRARRLEREYKVAEQVVKHSGELGYEVGKGGVRLSGVIYNHGGARVGHLVTNVVAYTADGLVKGISDGIREARSSSTAEGRRRCCGGGGEVVRHDDD